MNNYILYGMVVRVRLWCGGGWERGSIYLEKTLTGRRAIRVSCAVHPGRPLLRAVFVGDCIDGGVRRTSGGSRVGGIGGGGGGGADCCRVSSRDRVDTGLRVGTRQIDGRTQWFSGGRRRRPSAAIGFLVIRRRRAGRVIDSRCDRADRCVGAGSGRGIVTELVEMVKLIV